MGDQSEYAEYLRGLKEARDEVLALAQEYEQEDDQERWSYMGVVAASDAILLLERRAKGPQPTPRDERERRPK